MKVELELGKYVAAVSGGVDSVVLLDLLVKNSDFDLVVAHYDHGIRKNSVQDRQFVEKIAEEHQLDFFYEDGQLGPKASEALARTKRYDFLNRIKAQVKAKAIITAHHQDDLLETAIINLLRGTGRRGLSSLKSTNDIKRPLLNFAKQQIIDYAKASNLTWREDSTNQDEAYLRNWVRLQVIPKLSNAERVKLLKNISETSRTNVAIEQTIGKLLNSKLEHQNLDRNWFNQLPHDVAKEIMMAWLRQNELQFDRRRIEQLVIAAKSYEFGKTADIDKTAVLKIGKTDLALASRER